MSRGEGPSKGKVRTPEFGESIDFSDKELDLDAQRVALQSWKAAQQRVHSQSDVPRIEEIPDSDTGVKRDHANSRTSARAGMSVATKVARAVDPRKGGCRELI